MGPLYRKNQETRSICRKLLSLNLMPAEKIPSLFYVIMSNATGLLRRFCLYIEKTWINHSVWPPSAWSMFMQLRRNNNNAEGCHNHLKKLVGTSSPNFFKFLFLIHSDSEKIDLKAKLLSQKQGLMRLSRNTQEMQSKLSKYWEDFKTR